MKRGEIQETSEGPAQSPPNGVKTRRYNWFVCILAVAFALSFLVVGFVVYLITRDLTISYTGVGINPFQPSSGGRQSGAPEEQATPTLVTLSVTPRPWDGKSRVTVLVMGIDYRDWAVGSGSPRSDTMMLVTVDPVTRQAGMLSIPRDLWVEIPGFGHNRINTAYMFGEAYNTPGGGPALAVRTVEKLIGVPISYYAVVDFHAFERMVDEIGGIEVEISEPLRIAPIGRKAHVLQPGTHHLDGPDALAYARVRKGAGDDFGRAERQQEVLVKLLERVVRLDMLPKLVQKAPALYQELASGVRTDLSLEQMISLAWLSIKIPREQIQSGVIGPPKMVGFYTRPDGAQVLRPVPDAIRSLRDRIFTETSAFGPSVPLTPTPSPP